MNKRTIKQHLTQLTASLLMLAAIDGLAGETTRVSVDSAGRQGLRWSQSPSISADGRFVAFSTDYDLVAGDYNYTEDVFVHDRSTGKTTIVSVNWLGSQPSSSPSISADGRFVAFISRSDSLVANDTNGVEDVFVHDRNTGKTTRVSVDSAGIEGNDSGYWYTPPSISADGRFVTFESKASNLVKDDTNNTSDVFVHDRNTGQTTRVSVDSAGLQGNQGSSSPRVSADGRFVAFTSDASNLVSGDTNNTHDVFVHDRSTGQTTRVSVDSAGLQGNTWSSSPSISSDGRFVAFESVASNLVTGDTNNNYDVFVHDRKTGKTTRVSVDSAGLQGNSLSLKSDISANGRFVAFQSLASNLVIGDTNKALDKFVHDRSTGKTTRVSVNSAGEQANHEGDSSSLSISADGRFVAFTSFADNLVAGDSNQGRDIFVRDRLLNPKKSADLQVVAFRYPTSVQKDRNASYFYIVINKGPDDIGNVSLIDIIANGKVTKLTPSQGYCKRAAVSTCNLGKLSSGASLTLIAEIQATTTEPLVQRLSVTGEAVDPAPRNNRVKLSTPVTP